MTYLSQRPSPWLLAPAATALMLLGVAHRDIVFPSICLLCMVGSYFHPWCASLPKRHPWYATILACGALLFLCWLYDWVWLLNGEGLTDVRRFWYKPRLVSTGAILQAAVLLWTWHLPSRATGLILACMGLIAISSGYILPSSSGTVNLYALFGGTCLLSCFALSGALHGGRDRPWREQCRQGLVVLACIAIISAGTWYVSTSLRHVGQLLDTLRTDLISGSSYPDTIGAGDSIRIVHQRHVRLSQRVVATLSGSQSPVYLRTQVMTRYHQQRWTSPPALAPQPLLTKHRRASQDTGLRQRQVRLHVNLRGAVPLPYDVARFHAPKALSCQQTAGAIVHCSPSSQLTSYAFESSATHVPIPFGIGLALRVQDTAASPSEIARSLQQALAGPEAILSQLRPMARRISGSDTTHTLAAAQNIQQHFQRHFSYSRQVNLAPERDPMVDFVRHRRPAYCEYFASGMALMLRALGIPARLVGGFRVGEYHTRLQQWIIRQRDAHAWVEVYDDIGQRWVGFDPTPAFRQARFARTGLVEFLNQSRAWAAWQIRTIVNKLYQIDFVAWFMQLRQLKVRLTPSVGRSVMIAVAIASAYWLWRRLHRSMYRWWQHSKWPVHQRPAPTSDPVQAEAQQHFARVATLLQRQGLPILPTETLEEYLQRMPSRDRWRAAGPIWTLSASLSQDDVALIKLLTAFMHAYRQLRFRPGPEAPEARQVLVHERLLIIRQVTDQIQQMQRDRAAMQQSSE